MPAPFRRLRVEDCQKIVEDAFCSSGEMRFGLESEWFTISGSEGCRPSLEALSSLAARVMPRGSRTTIEPGGQLELSTCASHTIGSALESLEEDERELRELASSAGVGLIDGAIDTTRVPNIILQSGRYAAMRDFWNATDGTGLWMMANTASLQINVSNSSVAPSEQWVASNLVGPLAQAIFANSGGVDRLGGRWESLRQGVWFAMDPGRTLPLDLTQEPAKALLEYAMGADIFFIRTDDEGAGVPVGPGLSFGSWLTGGSEWGWPSVEDFAYHLTTLFPPIRPKGWLEFRMIDSIPARYRAAAALFIAVATTTSCAKRIIDCLEETEVDWTLAARSGMRDEQIRLASMNAMQEVLMRLDEVDAAPQHRESIREFADLYTLRGQSLSFRSSQQLPALLGGVAVLQS